MSVPISIGVTGHRDLRQEEIARIRAQVGEELDRLRGLCPDSELVMVNSLAAGGDTLCAEEALKRGIKLVCPLPIELEEYKKHYSPEEQKQLDYLLSKADQVFVAPDFEKTGKENESNYRFRQADIYVVEHAHVLLALWDGTSAKEGGCGTSETVDFMRRRSYRQGFASFLKEEGAVIHIPVSRMSGNVISEEIRRTAEKNNKAASGMALEELLKRTNEYNKDCQKKKKLIRKRPLFESEEKSETVKKLENSNASAAAMSRCYQKKYFRSLGILSACSVLLVMSYLLYDSGEMMFMLPVYAAVLGIYFLIYKSITHGKFHEKYIQYRMLAESLRVQTFLSALGISENVGDFYTWTQKQDALWIMYAMRTLTMGENDQAVSEPVIRKAWISDQARYHHSAYGRNHTSDQGAEKVTGVMLVCIAVLFAVVFALEYGLSSFMTSEWLGILWRDWLKILWGSISAVALFVSGYYGNLSFERKADDNEKMSSLFEEAEKACEASEGDTREIYLALAREEIIENGNWASYCKENKPMFNL